MPSSRDLIKESEADGWTLDRVTGSHHIFKHPTKPGIVVVAHPQKDVAPDTVRSIRRQAGIR